MQNAVLTLSDPGYFRQLTISKTIVSIFTISYMCILPGVFGMSHGIFLNSRFVTFYSDFKIKSSENSCKNDIFVISFKIDFKYTKRRRILMWIPGRYDHYEERRCLRSRVIAILVAKMGKVANKYVIAIIFHLFTINGHKF